jgi:hypothetical protein
MCKKSWAQVVAQRQWSSLLLEHHFCSLWQVLQSRGIVPAVWCSAMRAIRKTAVF